MPILFRLPMTVNVFAPAKVNLTLHITGQRDDGFHLIDSLVAFAPVGDHLTISDAPVLSLTVEGPEAAGVPADMNNLVMQVAKIMAPDRGLAMSLHKNLPVASGIGGGSTDAAAVVRALLDVGDTDAEFEKFVSQSDEEFKRSVVSTLKHVIELGADITMCLLPGQQRVSGIGEKCERVELPILPALLVNPRIAVSTKEIFGALKLKENAPMDDELPDFKGVSDFADWLSRQRNDLETPALQICPDIGKVLGYLGALDGCLLARMSGSGATCFAIFKTPEIAQANAKIIQRERPEWWLSGGGLGTWIEKSEPVFS